MSSLQLFDNDGIELVIDNKTGASFATQAGYSRMSGVDYATIRKRIERLKGSDKDLLKSAELQTSKGLQAVTLIHANLVFKWMIKDNPELAIKMGESGANIYLLKIAGYKVSITDSESEPPKSSVKDESKVATVLGMIKASLLNCGIENALVEGVYLNGIAHHYPEFAPQVNEAHKLLAANTPSDLLLTPTSIGKRLGISAIQVNLLLRKLGYQKQNIGAKKGEPAYLPTEKGKPFTGNTIATGRVGDDSSYQHLKWKESILDILSSEVA